MCFGELGTLTSIYLKSRLWLCQSFWIFCRVVVGIAWYRCGHSWAGLIALALSQNMEFWPARSHMNRCSYNITGHRAETTPDIVKEMAASGAIPSHLVHLRVLSVEGTILGLLDVESVGIYTGLCWNLCMFLPFLLRSFSCNTSISRRV